MKNGLTFDAFSEIVRAMFLAVCLFDRVLVEYWHAGHTPMSTADLIAGGLGAGDMVPVE